MIIKGGGGIKLTDREKRALATMLAHAEVDLSYQSEGSYYQDSEERRYGKMGVELVREIVSVIVT